MLNLSLAILIGAAPADAAPSLIDYLATRSDLNGAVRAEWDRELRRVFGGKAMAPGDDEGVAAARDVLSAAIFFEVPAGRAVRAAHQAFHDVYRFVPPPIAVQAQILAFQGRPPAASPRQMAHRFLEHYDADIAPALLAYWRAALAAGRVSRVERARVEAVVAGIEARLARDRRPPATPAIVAPRGWQRRLEQVVASWIGTPYRWGGASRRGVDCSALTQAIVAEVFAVTLPRSSAAQYQAGSAVSRGELRPGDLLFFDTLDRGRVTHVGLYLGDDTFVHASSSRGVTRAQLSKAYYQRAWVGARRLLAPERS